MPHEIPLNFQGSLNAAMWTTMAEVGSANDENKTDATATGVEEVLCLCAWQRLSRIDYRNRKRTDEEKLLAEAHRTLETTFDEAKTVSALKSFINRVVVNENMCPYTKDADISATGLEMRGVAPGAVGYRFSPTTDACMVMSSFWNIVCEMMSVPEDELSSVMLSLPGIGMGESRDAHDRFAAVVELVGDATFGLVHFHPAYDRSVIHPLDKPAYGHLPPTSWLRPILKKGGALEEAESLSNEELLLSNYQRRAPHTAINFLRASQLTAAAGPNSICDLDGRGGVVEKASGIKLYTRNTIRMAEIGEEHLRARLKEEVDMQSIK
ncbi:hypothetical protein THAOC_06219 [Thalassiosira oceanica]|uniref:Uncharacterized protein n=1 Tax=Thalassiosira oceanica TaxID=159749 RepID=K0TLY5_THAOC|nr:hypothetical protein THAOC_06219 [Thalassiosira oceanica]|eukprot:EJK72262.1 hypothetical protein THAOC_06219 [Thalassiosira oceanica]